MTSVGLKIDGSRSLVFLLWIILFIYWRNWGTLLTYWSICKYFCTRFCFSLVLAYESYLTIFIFFKNSCCFRCELVDCIQHMELPFINHPTVAILLLKWKIFPEIICRVNESSTSTRSSSKQKIGYPFSKDPFWLCYWIFVFLYETSMLIQYLRHVLKAEAKLACGDRKSVV